MFLITRKINCVKKIKIYYYFHYQTIFIKSQEYTGCTNSITKWRKVVKFAIFLNNTDNTTFLINITFSLILTINKRNCKQNIPNIFFLLLYNLLKSKEYTGCTKYVIKCKKCKYFFFRIHIFQNNYIFNMNKCLRG